MRIKLWPQDTIARRLALTIVVAIAVAVSLAGVLVRVAGVWGEPPLNDSGLVDRADDIVRMIEVASPQDRQRLANVALRGTFRVDWYAGSSMLAGMLDAAASLGPRKGLPTFDSGGQPRRVVAFDTDDRNPTSIGLFKTIGRAHAYFLSVELRDGSWVVFTALKRVWGVERPTRIGIGLALLTISIIAVTAVATYQLSRPIKKFTEALRRFGADPRASPIPETGPRELRASIGAFNAMQAQIQTFVEDRTTMLAAISHDLRTPLTKMRLRGEFVEDEEQRARLFGDVDDMQVMVESALAFFRDDFQDEETTPFDLPELLRTIADDYSDQGHEVRYAGTERLVFRGRPFALKRAFANLVDNAVKYGQAPELELACLEQRIVVSVRDRGPGIPPESVEQVFAPFFRLERSRNRATGGVGLGLTSARAVIRAHGGKIDLCNRIGGGLEVQVTLQGAVTHRAVGAQPRSRGQSRSIA